MSEASPLKLNNFLETGETQPSKVIRFSENWKNLEERNYFKKISKLKNMPKLPTNLQNFSDRVSKIKNLLKLFRNKRSKITELFKNRKNLSKSCIRIFKIKKIYQHLKTETLWKSRKTWKFVLNSNKMNIWILRIYRNL